MESRSAPAPPAPLEVFAARRSRLMEKIGKGIAVVVPAPELLKSRDTEVLYRASSDLYYLTGVLEPEAAAILNPGDAENPFTLFVRKKDPSSEVWTGKRIGVDAAREQFGADAVYPIDELETRVEDALRKAPHIYYPVGRRPALDAVVADMLRRAKYARQRSGDGVTSLTDLESITGEMRLIKDEHEIERMRTAARISAAAHKATMEGVHPGIGEWELQAILEAKMREMGAAGPAFPSIVAGGANATVLHYVTNNADIGPDDLVLVDAGAEWGMYAGDITRTFPVSGRFTPRQRQVYEIVLAAEKAAIEVVAPGVPVTMVHEAARRIILEGLIDLGIVRDETLEGAMEADSHKPFFMHQTSHWIGLDVHDVGLYSAAGEPTTLAAGMVLTIEPGLYFPETGADLPEGFAGIGIRIEDDVLVTETGYEILTRDVPVSADEIEALVGSGARVALEQ